MQQDLPNDFIPLAARLRPKRLSHFFGQLHLLGEGKPIRLAIEKGLLHSMVLWGPPGSGKTTLAHLMAESSDAEVERLSAVLDGVKEIRKVIAVAKTRLEVEQKATILFIDEIHRFNKAQQDVLLPYIEQGTVTLIGATTENPAFELNSALLSRVRVYVLKRLNDQSLAEVLQHALQDGAQGYGALEIVLDDEAKEQLIVYSDGDARLLLNTLSLLVDELNESGKVVITKEAMTRMVAKPLKHFDKQGDVFYEQISALHKSVRGSNPDAALYWFTRLLEVGCDPLYIARRVVRMASEDIGNADPRALQLALNAWEVQERLGSPEGELAIAQAIVYLACAAKSNAVELAFNEAKQAASMGRDYPVPMHLRNAPAKLMKELGYGKAYRYAHDEPHAYAAGEHYFPDEMIPQQFYRPVDRGLEKQIQEKLSFLRGLDEAASF